MTKNIIALTSIVTILLITVVYMMSESLVFFECKVEFIRISPSPDSEKNAVVFKKDCGATTAISTHLGISTTDTIPEDSVFIIENSEPIELEWADEHMLNVFYKERDKLNIFKQAEYQDNVYINYTSM